MFYSENLNLLFIAAPKTGSTSVESFLLQLDPDGERFKIVLADRIIDSSHVNTASLRHATARELRQVLGHGRYDRMTTIGFVRDPVEKMVSAYNFIRQDSFLSAFRIRSSKSKWPLVARRLLVTLVARAVPFWVWVRVYPMKRCADYFLDENGNLIVDYLGCTNRLTEDLVAILGEIGIDSSAVNVPHLNRSDKAGQSAMGPTHSIIQYIQGKYRTDVLLHQLVRTDRLNCADVEESFKDTAGLNGLSPIQSMLKRSFDLVASAAGLIATSWLIAIAWILASIDTRSNGFFTQSRIGKDGRPFKAIKIRTMRQLKGCKTNVTTADDPRITRLGRIFRKTKIDELPQLWNVLIGKMSFVGPRPDVPGFADALTGRDRAILRVRPGITGPATLKYRNEEALLASVGDPERYNQDVIYPDKVRLNREYVENWSFWGDIGYILETLFGTKHA